MDEIHSKCEISAKLKEIFRKSSWSKSCSECQTGSEYIIFEIIASAKADILSFCNVRQVVRNFQNSVLSSKSNLKPLWYLWQMSSLKKSSWIGGY